MDLLLYNDITVIVESDKAKEYYQRIYRCRRIRNITFSATTVTIDIAEEGSYTEEMLIIHKVPKLKIIID